MLSHNGNVINTIFFVAKSVAKSYGFVASIEKGIVYAVTQWCVLSHSDYDLEVRIWTYLSITSPGCINS